MASILEEAKAVCDPIMIDLRRGPVERELAPSLLFAYQRKLGGWLSTLGEFAGEAYSIAEDQEAEANEIWGQRVNSFMAMKKSATGSELLADADPDYHEHKRGAARARGDAKKLILYHKAVMENIQICKKIQDGIFKVKDHTGPG